MKCKQIVKRILPDEIICAAKLVITKLNNRRMVREYRNIKNFNFQSHPKGINLIGDIKAETGLGQSMRILAHMLKASGINFNVYQIDVYQNLEQSENEWDDKVKSDAEWGINLIHVNPGEWAKTYIKLNRNILDKRYNIAFWLWELEEFPKEWIPCIDTVDEIWTPSEFISSGIRKVTDKPVITVPYAINYLTKEIYDRNYFGLPKDKFLFLTMYDAISVSERKNPKAAIKAFKQAFSPQEDNIGLIIKVNHLKNKEELSELKKELEAYPNIYYIDRNLTRREIESLVADANVLVSLHRAEGFGLPIAEAMYVGTPVVATNWSAITEFTDEKSACLVDYTLVKLDKNIGPYKKGNRWAEADIMDAASYMRKLYENKEYYDTLEKNGRKKIREELCSHNTCKIIKERTEMIYEKNSIH